MFYSVLQPPTGIYIYTYIYVHTYNKRILMHKCARGRGFDLGSDEDFMFTFFVVIAILLFGNKMFPKQC